MSPHHIPFPKAFLAVNTPLKKTSSNNVASPSESDVPAHGFLSNINRPADVPRHSSISSVSSVGSTSSTASAPAVEFASSPFPQPASHGFLSLNSKHAAPPTSAQAMKDAEKSGFLSNRV